MATATRSFDSLLADYAQAVAGLKNEPAATTPAEFIGQIQRAAADPHFRQITGLPEELNSAATSLTDALEADGTNRQELLARADDHLYWALGFADVD